MIKKLIFFISLPLWAQVEQHGVTAIAGAPTAPINSGASLPATCVASPPAYFHLTTAPAGSNLYACLTTNTWTQLSGATLVADNTGTITINTGVSPAQVGVTPGTFLTNVGSNTPTGSFDFSSTSLLAPRAGSADPGTCTPSKAEEFYNTTQNVLKRCYESVGGVAYWQPMPSPMSPHFVLNQIFTGVYTAVVTGSFGGPMVGLNNTGAGTYAVTNPAGFNGGSITMTTNASSAQSSAICIPASGGTGSCAVHIFPSFASTAGWSFETEFQEGQTTGGEHLQGFWDFTSTTGGNQVSAYIGPSGGNITIQVCAAGTCTTQSTGVAVSTNPVYVRIWSTTAGTINGCAINSAKICTTWITPITTNIPTADMGLMSYIVGNAASTKQHRMAVFIP